MWRSNAEWKDLQPCSHRTFVRWEHALNSGIPFLRTCRAIYHEALYEIYDLSELILRMEFPDYGRQWMIKDIRKLQKTYLTYIHLDLSDSFVRFVCAHREHEQSKITKIKIEIPPPPPSHPVDALRVRELARNDLTQGDFSRTTAKIEFIMLDGDNVSWSGVHVFEPADMSEERMTVSDAKVILLSF